MKDKRKCNECDHYVLAGITGKPFRLPYYGCELWECSFKPKRNKKKEGK